MMNYKVLLISLLFIVHGAFAQRKTRADRFYEKGDYINAASNYKLELDKGSSKRVLERLANSYYNVYEYKKAALYLSLYMRGKFPEDNKSFDNRYNFMMYQLRSALGDHEGAIEYLASFASQNNDLLDKEATLVEIEGLKVKAEDYTVERSRISSDFADFGAIKIDDTVYFVSDRSKNGLLNKNYKWTHRPFLDIYQVPVSDKLKPVAVPNSYLDVVNSKLHEGNFCFSKDKKTFYFSRSNSEKGKKKFDTLNTNQVYLYKTTYNDTTWTPSVKLPFNVEGYSMEHPVLSADETKLYFASNIPGGEGGFDIYYTTINSDGSYGTPVNLGKVINTQHREQFPFVSEEGNLFFSSNGHLGLGMMDLFVSENVQGGFTKPINLGAPINSQYDDFSLSYYDKNKGFFSSNRVSANDDIYSFEQIGEIFIREYIAKFEVRDRETKEYIPNVTVSLIDKNEKVRYENTLDTTAAFTLNLLPGTYQFAANADAYFNGQQFARVLEKNKETYILYLNKKPEPKDAQIVNTSSSDTIRITDRTAGTIALPSGSVPNTERTKLKLPGATAPCPCLEGRNATGVSLPKKPRTQILKELLADTIGPQIYRKDGKLFFSVAPIYFDYDRWNIRADSKKELDILAKKLERFETVEIKISSHTDNRGSESYNNVLSAKRAESTRNYLALEGFVNARRMRFEGFGELKPIEDCQQGCSDKQHQMNRRSEFEIINY